MFMCAVCHSKDSQEDTVEMVLKVDGRHVRVDGVPATVCRRCGESEFSAEAAERVRLLVRGNGQPTKTVPMYVYDYA